MSFVRAASRAASLRHAASTPARAFSAAAAAGPKLKHMTVSVQDGIAVVKMDHVDSPVNKLSQEFSNDLQAAMDFVESSPDVKAAVLISGKKGGFIAGADIAMLQACKNSEELRELSSNAQAAFAKFEQGKPKVAAIDGPCLGGGLEVALACHYRVATPKAKLGLPEVMLGLLPGAGGTVRMAKLLGTANTLPMVLAGKQVNGDKAKKMKLVDGVADPFALEHAGITAAKGLVDGTLKVSRGPKGFVQTKMKQFMEETEVGRNLMYRQARKGVMKQTKGQYPAPLRILDVTRTFLEKGEAAGYEAEANAFGDLGMTSQSKSLVTIYFADTQCKKNPFGKPKKQAQTVGILGAGLMGAGIAQVSIQNAKMNCVLKDTGVQGLARGEKQIYDNISRRVKRRAMSAPDRDRMMSKLLGVHDGDAKWADHVSRSDVMIEAVFEDMDLKHKVIKQIEPLLKADAVFATNTSALPIADVAKAAKRPERVVGMHYFSPVDKMPLLEIIPHAGTAKEVSAIATDVGLRQGKRVIVVKDVPGFYVNRCLGPYMAETIALLQAGASPEKLDKALTQFGMPVGPITLADEVGIDVAGHVQTFLAKHLGVRMQGGNVAALQEMMDSGNLGKKTGKGFFTYDAKKKSTGVNSEAQDILDKYRFEGSDKPISVEDMQQRMVLRFCNEAALCLQDSIVENPVAGDVGAVFGIGFPPFLGGPFRYMDAEGAQTIVDRMQRYRDVLGDQFTPAPILMDMAKGGKKFHTE